MKNKTYTIRLSEAMTSFINEQAKERQLLPSEYLRGIVQKEMEKEYERRLDKKAIEIYEQIKAKVVAEHE